LTRLAPLLLLLLAPAPQPTAPVAGRVVAVHDGDTVTVQAGRQTYHVRLLLIDAPELSQHPWGECARLYATAELLGRDVTLEFEKVRPDPYGRTLAYLRRAPDGTTFNEAIVRKGWAFYYDPGPELSRSRAVRAAEAKAKADGIGVHRPGQCPLQVPSEYRKALRKAHPERRIAP
jgi:endonuclease YncB( thermonuclease family)